jgi:ferredoxin-type protein NapH
MKKIQRIGIFLFTISLLGFVLSLSMSDFKLTDNLLKKEFGEKYNGNGQSYYDVLHSAFIPMFDKTYHSRVKFVGDYKATFNKVNDAFKAKGDWNSVLHENKVFDIVKHSSLGWVNNPTWVMMFFFIAFVLSAIGALMYILPEYKDKKGGIHNTGVYHSSATNRGLIGIIVGIFMIGFYVLLYFWPEYITNWTILLDPVSKAMSGNEASQWFLYGFMYTIAILVMGIRMILKYRDNKYQVFRTSSVMFFQLCFAFMIPQIMASFQLAATPDLKNIWPLDYNFFSADNINNHIASGTIGFVMFGWGVLLFLVGVPVFTWFFGKRWYCSWVCGCGGLAETLGDPYRQLSDKSLLAWKIERAIIYSVMIFAGVMTALVLVSYFTNSDSVLGISSGFVRLIYGFLIGSIFAGVIGTGFYPFMGSRVWCRFGCPLAAYIGIWQRKKSKFRITTNGGQCISCGNCSTYCEMGIDVRAYAQRGQNIVRASCVGCGVCSSVCPRGVLKLENGPEKDRISDDPIIIGHDGIKLNL